MEILFGMIVFGLTLWLIISLFSIHIMLGFIGIGLILWLGCR